MMESKALPADIINCERQITTDPLPIGMTRFGVVAGASDSATPQTFLATGLLYTKLDENTTITGIVAPFRNNADYFMIIPRYKRVCVPEKSTFSVNMDATFTQNPSGVVLFHTPSTSVRSNYQSKICRGGIMLWHDANATPVGYFQLCLFLVPEDRTLPPLFTNLGQPIKYSDIGYDPAGNHRIQASFRFGNNTGGNGYMVEVMNSNRGIIAAGTMPDVAVYRGGWFGGVLDTAQTTQEATVINAMSVQVR